MKAWTKALWLLLVVLLTGGCWDKSELIEFGYVQAVAIDQMEQGDIELTTLFYNPTAHSESSGSTSQAQKAIAISTQARSVNEAVQDIPLHFGRTAKWDHMRIILIGEKAARNNPIGELLDFFSRNHEQRATVLLMTTQGNAKDYIKIKPYIEYTIGQQLRKIEQSVSQFSAKTTSLPLYELAIQLEGETNVAIVPMASKAPKNKDIIVAGTALFKDQRLVKSLVSPANTQPLLMLLNRYKQGIIELPCPGAKQSSGDIREIFEVISIHTSVKPIIKGDELTVKVDTRLKGAVNELHCSSLQTIKDETAMRNRIADQVKGDMEKLIAYLQKHKLDALGIGNSIYRRHPALWKKWKPDWEERFANASFVINVDANILNIGLNAGETFGKKKGE
ncbi:Ger(x)C family spore germination protein [Paenibacillus sp. CAU 1782]